MRVLQVSAELFPLLKTGGLADVAGALPAALSSVGCDVRPLLPGFAPMLADLQAPVLVSELVTPWGETVALRRGQLASLGHEAYVIDGAWLYGRPGNPYEDPYRQPYGDNHRRFALLGWVASLLAQGLDPHWQPQVVHCHDWHAALAAAYLAHSRERQSTRVACVYTVHNLAYQGLFAAHHLGELGLPASAFAVDGLEYHGQLSFMKAGLFYADRITTVSPTYAREIQTPAQGCGLDGLLRARGGVLSGILNAVDASVWDPANDPLIPFHFAAKRLSGKASCKATLQRALGLGGAPRAPLLGVVSRLTEQKGLHLVLAAVDAAISLGAQLVVLGSGDAWLENAFRERAQQHPESLAVQLGYDEVLAHRIFAASDITLVPSRFEPCGLTQMYGLKYGSLPLVHRVGGLADTVVDCAEQGPGSPAANGFVFDEFSLPAFEATLRRALALYACMADWDAVVARAMQQPLSWQHSAAQYLALYQQLGVDDPNPSIEP
jgi:starch synthase